jgi:hypothetical protein
LHDYRQLQHNPGNQSHGDIWSQVSKILRIHRGAFDWHVCAKPAPTSESISHPRVLKELQKQLYHALNRRFPTLLPDACKRPGLADFLPLSLAITSATLLDSVEIVIVFSINAPDDPALFLHSCFMDLFKHDSYLCCGLMISNANPVISWFPS